MQYFRKVQTQSCRQCSKPLKGRSDKKFCDDVCRNAFFNAQKLIDRSEIRNIDIALKRNRKILKGFLDGKTSLNVTEKDLVTKGFVFLYHTHRYMTKDESKEYFFCYDFGYLPLANAWYKIVRSFDAGKSVSD